jgi:hypothetical protein
VTATRLVISGVPATGKTTVARYLAKNHGFFHIDMEDDSFRARRELQNNPGTFLDRLENKTRVVLSWGFSPYVDRPPFDVLQAAGYRTVWLDGDHVACLRNFLIREHYSPHREAEYYGQMQMVLATEFANRPGITRVNPFDGEKFRPLASIATEILERLNHAGGPE